MSFKFIEPTRTRNTKLPPITMTVSVAGNLPTGAPRLNLEAKISGEVMSSERLVHGDRVQVGFDENLNIAIKRVVEGSGYKITKQNKQTKYGLVKFTMPDYLPFNHGDKFICKEIETADGVFFGKLSQINEKKIRRVI